MKWCHALFILLAFLAFFGCGDFHFSVVSNGSLPEPATPPDTIRIPADSIVVERLFASNDTLFQSDASVRSQRRISVSFQLPTVALPPDSLTLYGTLIASTPLSIGISHSGAVDPVAYVQRDSADGRYTHSIRVQIFSGIPYELLWSAESGQPFQMGALLLIGYQTADSSSLQLTQPVKDYLELLPIATNRNRSVASWTHFWEPLYLESDDSLFAHLSSDSTLHAYLLDEAGMDAFWASGVAPVAPLWQASSPDTTLRWAPGKAQNLYFMGSNWGDSPRMVSDSVVVFRHLQDQ